MMFEARKIVSVLVLVFSSCLPLAAQQAGGTKVGVLSCRTSASLGLIVGSHQKLRCSFSPDNGPPENYIECRLQCYRSASRTPKELRRVPPHDRQRQRGLDSPFGALRFSAP